MLRGERIICQELDSPVLLVKVLYVPDEISYQIVGESLAKYGKVLNAGREMFRDWPKNWIRCTRCQNGKSNGGHSASFLYRSVQGGFSLSWSISFMWSLLHLRTSCYHLCE